MQIIRSFGLDSRSPFYRSSVHYSLVVYNMEYSRYGCFLLYHSIQTINRITFTLHSTKCYMRDVCTFKKRLATPHSPLFSSYSDPWQLARVGGSGSNHQSVSSLHPSLHLHSPQPVDIVTVLRGINSNVFNDPGTDTKYQKQSYNDVEET